MKKFLFAIIVSVTAITSYSQEWVAADYDGPTQYLFYSTSDWGNNKDTIGIMYADSLAFRYPVTAPNIQEVTLTAGAGIVITGTWPNFTISLEEPELAPGAPMKNGLEPFVLKVEYFDMSKNPLPGEPVSGHFVVWNYMSDGTIKKVQVEKK